jgi:protein phosphatase 2C
MHPAFLFVAGVAAVALVARRYFSTISAPFSRRRVETAQPYGAAESVGRRAYMEDRYVVATLAAGTGSARASLYGVFDGHAGARAAQFCTSFVAAAVTGDAAWPAAPATALTNAFLSLDESFLDLARSERPPLDDGTTALVAVVAGPRLFVASAGDSRAVLVGADGSVRALSDDHKPNRPDEAARIRALGGTVVHHGVWRVNGVLAVSRSIGDNPLKPFVSAQPEVTTVELGERDEALVLATDGLWDVLSNEAVAATVAAAFAGARTAAAAGARSEERHVVVQRVASALVRDAILAGSADNITVLVVDLRRAAAASVVARGGGVGVAVAAAEEDETMDSSDAEVGVRRRGGGAEEAGGADGDVGGSAAMPQGATPLTSPREL